MTPYEKEPENDKGECGESEINPEHDMQAVPTDKRGSTAVVGKPAAAEPQNYIARALSTGALSHEESLRRAEWAKRVSDGKSEEYVKERQ